MGRNVWYLTGLQSFPDTTDVAAILVERPYSSPGTATPYRSSTATKVYPHAGAPLASHLRSGSTVLTFWPSGKASSLDSALSGHDRMLRCSFGSHLLGSLGCRTRPAMLEDGRAVRNSWLAVFTPPLPNSRASGAVRCRFGSGPCWRCWNRSRPICPGRAHDPSLKRELRDLRYEPMNPRWEIADFEHSTSRLDSARVVMSRGEKSKRRATRPYLAGDYAYRSWHTTLPLTPAGVGTLTSGPWSVRIWDIREDFALPKIPTRTFAANGLFWN